jgi:radical SAM protein with 4Fe4S-binding SPASM domain
MVDFRKDTKTYTTKYQKEDILQPDIMKTNEWLKYRDIYEQAEKGKEFDYPVHVEIENIYACNLRCTHCARQYVEHVGLSKMDDVLYRKIIKDAVSIGTKAIGFAVWGEVFLDQDVFNKIAFAKDHGIIDIRLHSNGHLIDENIAEKIVDSGITWLSISLDASTQETYSKIRGGNYKKALTGLANIISAKIKESSLLPKLRVSFVKCSLNEHEADHFLNYFSRYCDIAIQEFWDPWNILPKYLVPKTAEFVRKQQCFDNFFKVFIRHNGTVVPCCEDMRSNIILGNINNSSLYEIYNSPIAKDLRNQHKFMKINNMTCRTCLGLDL